MVERNTVFQPPWRGRLAILVRMRWLAVSGVAAALLLAMSAGMTLPYRQMAAVTVLYAVCNILLWLRTRREDEGNNLEAFLQCALDLAVLTILLGMSGAAANPFVFLLVLPVALAAAMLTGRWTAAVIMTAVLCYTALLLVPVGGSAVIGLHGESGSSLALMSAGSHAHASDNQAYLNHLWGMWLAFIITAGFLGIFVHWIAASLRQRQAALAELEKRALRDSRILALGTFAAGAAHELATPLSTISVSVKDLLHDAPEGGLREQLQTIDTQSRACRNILERLAATARDSENCFMLAAPLEEILRGIVNELRALRPDVAPVIELGEPAGNLRAVFEGTLRQALLNILNNAADVSPGDVRIEAHSDESYLYIDVLDRGPGMPAEIPVQGRGAGGFGIGLMLAHSSVERLGGKLEFHAREGGGTCARFRLPLPTIHPA